MDEMASQIASLRIVTQPFIQAQVKENSPVNSPHRWPVTRKMFPFDDVIMELSIPKHTHKHCYSFNVYQHMYIKHNCIAHAFA